MYKIDEKRLEESPKVDFFTLENAIIVEGAALPSGKDHYCSDAKLALAMMEMHKRIMRLEGKA